MGTNKYNENFNIISHNLNKLALLGITLYKMDIYRI